MSGYRYDASKGRFSEVPARDITEEEFDRLSPTQKRIVLQSDAYKPVKSVKAEKADKPDAPSKGAAKADTADKGGKE